MARPAARGSGGMRRPARHEEKDPKEEAKKKWDKGENAQLLDLDPKDLMRDPLVVMEKAVYFHKTIKLAGRITGLILEEGASYLKLEPKGTDDDSLLQFHTGQPQVNLRLHVCGPDCNQEEVSDSLLHVKEIRKMKDESVEGGWANNLQKALPMVHPGGVEDELRELRARGDLVRGAGAEPKEDRKEKDEKGKKKKKEEKGKKKKKKGKKKKESEEEKDEESDSIAQDGTQARLACQKELRELYGGTGMDPRERVRRKVRHQAKKFLKRKADKMSSTSEDSGGSDSSASLPAVDSDGLFGESNRSRTLSERFPGVLTAEANRVLRESLIQEIGMQATTNELLPVGVSYYRQSLARRANGPVGRELLTMSAALDMLVRGQPSRASDILTQRVKAVGTGIGRSPLDSRSKTRNLTSRTCHLDLSPRSKQSPKRSVQGESCALGHGLSRRKSPSARTRGQEPRRQRSRQDRRERQEGWQRARQERWEEERPEQDGRVRRTAEGTEAGAEAPVEEKDAGVRAPEFHKRERERDFWGDITFEARQSHEDESARGWK